MPTNGIDAVSVDDKRKLVFFVQSKWITGSKSVRVADVLRFKDGVNKVISLKWDADNAALHVFRPKIEAALSDISTNVVMVIVHTSQTPMSAMPIKKMTDFLAEQNKYNPDFIEFREVGLTEIVQIARSMTRASDIDLTVLLRNWGQLNKPYKALYGAVSASDLVTWHAKYADKLFIENVRFVIEKSDVNESIMETAIKEPGHFWYYNNGITAICDTFEKQPIGGTTTDSGTFDVKKISVVNGAQTIGTLSAAKTEGAD